MLAAMRLLYTVLLRLALPLVVLRLLWKSRELRGYRQRIKERFGFVAAVPSGVAVWVHAVSVGEALAALPLLRKLIHQHGPGQVWVTTTTPTGSERITEVLGDQVRHSYLPYDLPIPVRRFLGRVQPRQVVMMETEIWPNLFAALERRAIPLTIANARLSPGSFSGYSRVPRFAAQTLARVTTVAAQSEADGERFKRLGAPRVQVLGNIKFDVHLPEDQIALGRKLRLALGAERPVWIAVSTHEGEEDAALTAHAQLLGAYPDAVLLLVPRHPQRFDAVAERCAHYGAMPARRSALDRKLDSLEPGSLTQPVLLGDSMGEMFVYLAAADIAFVGGSLATIGGHNVLEPAALGLPVVFGPYMYNFEAAKALLLDVGAALAIEDETGLPAAINWLFGHPDEGLAMAEAGRDAVDANRGALERLLALLNASS